ncbi:MAG: PAS domain S-box protein, partial [candidate division Zixibacteria bacterium]|nr:PAS domain S-box protein [candidate division Zixibacteria bacterium]
DDVYLSPRMKGYIGFDDEEFPNSLRAFNERVHPADRERLQKASRDHYDGRTGYFSCDFRIQHRNGEWRWVQSRGKIHRDEKGNPVRWIGIDWDITESRRNQERIRENEARFRALFEDSPIMLAEENYSEVMKYVRELQKSGIKDMKKYLLENDNELVKCESMIKLVNVNKASLRAYNAKSIAELKSHFTRIPTRDSAKALANTISKFAEGAKSIESELASRTLDGDEIYTYIKVSVAPGCEDSFSKVFVSLLDITDRKKSEQKLRASQEMFRALTENSPDIIMRFGKDLRPLYVNSTVAKYTGLKPGEIVGRTGADLGFSKEFAGRLDRRLIQVFETGEAYAGEYDIETSKGKFIFDWRVIPEFSSDGKVETVIATNRDITEMKRLQEFTQRAMRLETAGRIAGQVAHDFNNLLGPLMAYPDLIKDEFAPDHPMLSLLDDMKKATEQIADINQQLLTLGRRGHYKQEVLDLNDIVNQAVNRIFPLPQTLIIDAELGANLMNIKGGPAQILRAVSNLIANARDAMQDVGHLRIATENAYNDEITGGFGRVPRGEYVKLTIADTGTGIDPEALPKIFDPFFTTKSSSRKKGSGLGLSVVHAVMEDHGGHIDFDSVPGEGTSIFLYFPITREVKTIGVSDQIAGGSEKILIVDDDRVQRDVCQKLLDKLGYHAKLAESGAVALEMLREEKFDLILLDMVMPGGLDGSETYEKALEINPGQKAIIISGFAESDRVNKALDMGAGDFIRKPLTLKSIAAAVRAELDKKKVGR